MKYRNEKITSTPSKYEYYMYLYLLKSDILCLKFIRKNLHSSFFFFSFDCN